MTDTVLYRLADVLMLVLHGSLVVFNVLGWAWRRTRRLHLWTILATLGSWFGLGLVYGWGYCPLTEWHWRVKRALGATELPASWVKYYLDRLAGFAWDPAVVDGLVIVSTTTALALSASLTFRDRRRDRQRRKSVPPATSAPC